MIATWQEVVAEHIGSFVIGLLVGWVTTSRYRIVKRNGKERDG